MNAITQTITITTKCRLMITAVFEGINTCGCSSNGSAIVDIKVNGVEAFAGDNIGPARIFAGPGFVHSCSIPNFFYDVMPGTYTIEFFTQDHIGSQLAIYSKYSTIIALPID